MIRITALLFCLTASLFSLEWNSFNLILNPPTTTTSNNVFLTYNSLSGQILATWGDSHANPATPLPTYSFYDGTNWSFDTINSTPLTISTTSGVASDLYTAFNPVTGEFLATWADSKNANLPTYSIYNSILGWSHRSLQQQQRWWR